MRLIALLLLLSGIVKAACLGVAGDNILTGDLARSIPAFDSLDPAIPVGYAPLPGAHRTFTAREIEAMARRFGLNTSDFAGEAVCFERSAQLLDPAAAISVMAATLGIAAGGIDLLEYSRAPLPLGRLEFPKAGANFMPSSPDPERPVLWRGRLLSPSGRSFPIWARVRAVVESEAVQAATRLSKGQKIAREQLAFVRIRHSAFFTGYLNDPDQAAGRILKTDVAAGQPVQAASLEEPREVEQGQTVRVESISGQAQISFEAKAQSAGRTGDSVLVQNPANGRPFRAIVVDKGKVRVGKNAKT